MDRIEELITRLLDKLYHWCDVRAERDMYPKRKRVGRADANGFVIRRGILKQYTGPGGAVTVPEGVIGIEAQAFEGCTGLTSVTLPESVTEIEARAFENCTGLTSVTLPKGLTAIGKQAFLGCEALTSIALPEGLTGIEEQSFLGCIRLRSVTLPKGLTHIGARAFHGCTVLEGMALPESLSSIGERAFTDCAALTNIALPAGLTALGAGAFSGCRALTTLTIRDGCPFIARAGVLYSPDMTRVLCATGRPEHIVLPEGVTRIGLCAFRGCDTLTSIVLPDGLISLDMMAFEHCSALRSITLPESVTDIDIDTLNGCDALTSFAMPWRLWSSLGFLPPARCPLEHITLVGEIPAYADILLQDLVSRVWPLRSIRVPRSEDLLMLLERNCENARLSELLATGLLECTDEDPGLLRRPELQREPIFTLLLRSAQALWPEKAAELLQARHEGGPVEEDELEL